MIMPKHPQADKSDLVDLFEEKNLKSALEHLFDQPGGCLDLYFDHPTERCLANFLDAIVYRSRQEALHCCRSARSLLSSKKDQKTVSLLNAFEWTLAPWESHRYLEHLPINKMAPREKWAISQWHMIPCETTLLDQLLSFLPNSFHSILHLQWESYQAWLKFKAYDSNLFDYLAPIQPFCYLPTYPFGVFCDSQTHSLPTDHLVIWPDLYTSNLPSLPSERKAIILFANLSHLYQIVSQPSWNQLLWKYRPWILVADRYPLDQLRLQVDFVDQAMPFSPYSLQPDPQLSPYIFQLAETLSKLSHRKTSVDEAGIQLNVLGKKLNEEWEGRRYGICRSPDYQALIDSKRWHDPHKERPHPSWDLGPKPKDYFEIKLKELSQERTIILPKSKPKYRIAHVAQQLVDQGHAPSHLITTLIEQSNFDRFEPHLILTEALQYHPDDYPANLYWSKPSQKRASHRLKKLEQMNVPVWIESANGLFEKRVHLIADLIKEQAIDCVIFHGADVTNTMAAQLCCSPLRVLFEHGTLPKYPGFDLAIVSTEVVLERERDFLKQLGTKAVALPFAYDVRHNWPESPPSRKELDLPEEGFILTTISNHLAHRLSPEMCLAIAEILHQSPDAHYAPMGSIDHESKSKLISFFETRDLKDRVHFLGFHPNPSHVARCMQIYLNEFPFGSCLGMLDAMAAGCAVVSMDDPNGPPQARYGSAFLGADFVIDSGRRQDYVKLTLQLIQDPLFYTSRSKHATACYNNHTDVQAYVKEFEEIISTSLKIG